MKENAHQRVLAKEALFECSYGPTLNASASLFEGRDAALYSCWGSSKTATVIIQYPALLVCTGFPRTLGLHILMSWIENSSQYSISTSWFNLNTQYQHHDSAWIFDTKILTRIKSWRAENSARRDQSTIYSLKLVQELFYIYLMMNCHANSSLYNSNLFT